MSPEKTTSELLQGALDQIVEHGWCPEPYVDRMLLPATPTCIWGALHIVVNGPDPVHWNSFDGDVAHCLSFVKDVVGQSAISWNCEPGRTQAEVVTALAAARDLAAA